MFCSTGQKTDWERLHGSSGSPRHIVAAWDQNPAPPIPSPGLFIAIVLPPEQSSVVLGVDGDWRRWSPFGSHSCFIMEPLNNRGSPSLRLPLVSPPHTYQWCGSECLTKGSLDGWRGREALICGICWFLRCKYSLHGQLEDNQLTWPNVELGKDTLCPLSWPSGSWLQAFLSSSSLTRRSWGHRPGQQLCFQPGCQDLLPG